MSVNPCVRLQNNVYHVALPLPAPALVVAPSAASKFAPSTASAVKAEPAKADQSDVNCVASSSVSWRSNVITKYRLVQQPNIMSPINVAFAKFAVRQLHQQQQTQQQLIDAWNATHADRWGEILQ
jgi:hypothetical protein